MEMCACLWVILCFAYLLMGRDKLNDFLVFLGVFAVTKSACGVGPLYREVVEFTIFLRLASSANLESTMKRLREVIIFVVVAITSKAAGDLIDLCSVW